MGEIGKACAREKGLDTLLELAELPHDSLRIFNAGGTGTEVHFTNIEPQHEAVRQFAKPGTVLLDQGFQIHEMERVVRYLSEIPG